MAPETTQIEHACGVSRINHQDQEMHTKHRGGYSEDA